MTGGRLEGTRGRSRRACCHGVDRGELERTWVSQLYVRAGQVLTRGEYPARSSDRSLGGHLADKTRLKALV